MKLKLYLGNRIIKLSIAKNLKHRVWTRGTLNRTEDGKYIFYIDYDLMRESYIVGEIKHLQEVFGIGDILLFRSSEKGFHAIAFAKFTALEYITILQNSSCDYLFKLVPSHLTYRNWVLRHFSKGTTSKPKYLYTIKSKTKKEQSLAHYNYIRYLYPEIQMNKLINSDGITHLTQIDYVTANNTGK